RAVLLAPRRLPAPPRVPPEEPAAGPRALRAIHVRAGDRRVGPPGGLPEARRLRLLGVPVAAVGAGRSAGGAAAVPREARADHAAGAAGLPRRPRPDERADRRARGGLPDRLDLLARRRRLRRAGAARAEPRGERPRVGGVRPVRPGALAADR